MRLLRMKQNNFYVVPQIKCYIPDGNIHLFIITDVK